MTAATAIVSIIVLLAIAGVAVFQKQQTHSSPHDRPSGTDLIGIPAQGIPTLIEFGMARCAACKAMQGVLNELRETHPDKLKVLSINISEHPETAAEWRILAVPTQVLLDAQGKELNRHMGFYSAAAIRADFASNGIVLQVPEPSL